METLRLPRPLGLTKAATLYRDDPTKNNKARLRRLILQAFLSGTLYYPYPTFEAFSHYPTTPPTKNKKKNLRTKESINRDNTRNDTKVYTLKTIENKELSFMMGISASQLQRLLEKELIRQGTSMVDSIDENDAQTTSRAMGFRLFFRGLNELEALSGWEEELKAVSRAFGYKASILKEANSAIGHKLGHLTSLQTMALKLSGQGTHNPNPGITINNNNMAQNLNDGTQLLTTSMAIRLLEDKGLNHTSLIDYEGLEATYLTDPDIPDIKALPTDAQGISVKKPNELVYDTHETRREKEIGEVQDATEV